MRVLEMRLAQIKLGVRQFFIFEGDNCSKEITDSMSHLPIALLYPQGHFPALDQV